MEPTGARTTLIHLCFQLSAVLRSKYILVQLSNDDVFTFENHWWVGITGVSGAFKMLQVREWILYVHMVGS